MPKCDKNLPWYIHRIYDVVGDNNNMCRVSAGFVRAIPLPYQANLIERIFAAWWIITGKAHAFIWPKDGDLELALGTYPKEPKDIFYNKYPPPYNNTVSHGHDPDTCKLPVCKLCGFEG